MHFSRTIALVAGLTTTAFTAPTDSSPAGFFPPYQSDGFYITLFDQAYYGGQSTRIYLTRGICRTNSSYLVQRTCSLYCTSRGKPMLLC
ncbi:hypothetical protein GQ53DRAFT_101966 [Thozetella sp. PMI_491]|nr:hypothetical protein GQ53DRAFT_101966 [Thozetella sp. PMI_491]